MVERPEGNRARILEAIAARRRGVDHYLAEKRPVSSRLSYISVISSCLAAALAVGPAVGGETFAQTVQHGLGLGVQQTVWRTLCFVTVIISVTAAIATNLSKSSDLVSRIAAAETANGALDGLQMRLQVGLPAAEAAQQYQEIVARIPWIQVLERSSERENPDSQGRRLRLAAPYLAGTAVVSAVVLVITFGGLLAGLANAAPSTTISSKGSPAPVPSPPVTSSSVVSATPASGALPAVYSGHTSGGVGIAVAVNGNEAVAYVCDGNSLEAWLQGSVEGDHLTVKGKNGGLVGLLLGEGGQMETVATVKGQRYQAVIDRSGSPAGVYEARIANPSVRIGWAVLKSGAQLGVDNNGGIEVPAPALRLSDHSFVLNGKRYAATLITSPSTVSPTQ